MLPVLRRFLDIFSKLEMLHGHVSSQRTPSVLHEAQALLRKIDGRQEEEGRETTEPPLAEKQNVLDSPQRNGTVARA